jgi:hypothetical protein
MLRCWLRFDGFLNGVTEEHEIRYILSRFDTPPQTDINGYLIGDGVKRFRDQSEADHHPRDAQAHRGDR